MLKLSKLFGDHAVLQRNRTIVVWGWCDPFTSVSGTLGTATSAPRISVFMPPVPAETGVSRFVFRRFRRAVR